MDQLQRKLIKEIAEEHNVSSKTLLDILKSSENFTYNTTTPGQRVNEYYGLIKFAASQELK